MIRAGRYGDVQLAGDRAARGRHRARLGAGHQHHAVAELAGLPARPRAGGREGAWAYANLGVLIALVIGFVGTLILTIAVQARRHDELRSAHGSSE